MTSYAQDDTSKFSDNRFKMVEHQIVRRGITDKKVLNAIRKVPRHLFVPDDMVKHAYTDGPLPIGYNQTISQPYIVALMTELLKLNGTEKILEIGTGSGYQAAILAEIVNEVYSIEIVEPLAKRAQETIKKMGYENVYIKSGDGFHGWPEHAPFDGIIVTAAPREVPAPLIDQLKDNGRLVIPEGEYYQELRVYIKRDGYLEKKDIIPVRFVPMTGYIEQRSKQ
ncbi:MAG: protein-L-isoaspartate(D-aspartate) O-methyltransferase [Candidatus Auribacterota bacterium]|nr:protein-L-isoaspartate(D-aspartate) O-methyltransferase [Candidatus Auribacterota bacterium]